MAKVLREIRQKTWTMHATLEDRAMLDAERKRLKQRNPDAEFTRSYLLRSLMRAGFLALHGVEVDIEEAPTDAGASVD